MSFALAHECPVCASSRLRPILRIDNCPVHCNVLLADPLEALKVARADIDIVFCENCTHSFNRAFRPELLEYDGGYENSLYFSPTFREYAEKLIQHLTARFGLYDKAIVEIGSGDGRFLTALCEAGKNRGVGFDPSAPSRNIGESLAFVSDLYSERYADTEADFVCCRHVLEHIEKPLTFLATVRSALLKRPDAGLYFEVPNAAFLLESGSIWDFIYAHVSYYSGHSLRALFERAGFPVASVTSTFGGQFLGIETGASLPDRDSPLAADQKSEPTVSFAATQAFGDLYCSTVEYWNDLLLRETSAGKKVVLWGGGAKCVSFAGAMSDHRMVSAIVDVNPRKQGLFIPGTGVPVVAPNFLCEHRPDLVIVVNPIYESEIRLELARMGLAETRVQALRAVSTAMAGL